MNQNDLDIQTLAGYMNNSSVICFYGGAGTSTESGIPDYRSRFGVWTKMRERNMNPQYFASHKRLLENPEEFFRVRRKSGPDPEPNATHEILANLEKNGTDIRIITQNVDGLHQKAGHRFVLELHGEHRTWYCMDCGRIYNADELERDENGVPRCYVDKGIVRPNVVYFGESADSAVIEKSRKTLKESNLLIIAGTSLTTGLAKRLIREFEGDHIVIINKEPLNIDPLDTSLFIQRPVGEVLQEVEPMVETQTNINK